MSSAYPILLWWSWECVLYLIIIIKPAVWIINHCLGLGHETPGRRQAIIWTNAEKLFIGPLATKFSEILFEIHAFNSRKVIWKCRLENGGCLVLASMCWYYSCAFVLMQNKILSRSAHCGRIADKWNYFYCLCLAVMLHLLYLRMPKYMVQRFVKLPAFGFCVSMLNSRVVSFNNVEHPATNTETSHFMHQLLVTLNPKWLNVTYVSCFCKM